MQMEANVGKHGIRLRALALLAACVAVLALLATWRPALAAQPTDDPTALVVVAAGWAAWALTVYLAIGVGVASAAHLGVHPRGISALVPRTVRRLVEVTVGASTAAAVCLAPTAAFAAPPGPAPTTTASPLDWPALAAPPPPAHPSVRTAAPAAARLAPTERLTVRPGDSLWSLTARRLGPQATPARIAASWPRLYAMNRRLIGPDADLIHPGQRLVAPPTEERTSR